ncbi:MAG: LPS export ABC transporter permease LptF [Gammaproteobacteria bacterium]
MFQIFDRYLLKEVISSWFAVTAILTLVLVSNKLVSYLGDAAAGDIPGEVVFRLLGLQMVLYLVMVVPFALALGVVLGLGRLYRDHEMVVLSACGVGPGRIYKPLMTLGVLVGVVLAWLTLQISPEVQGMKNRLRASAKQQADLTVLGAGRFNVLHGGRVTFYAERLSDDRNRMENVFVVFGVGEESDGQLLTAKSAYRTLDEASGDDFLVLVDGHRYEGNPGQADYRVMQFGKYGVRVELPGAAEVVELREATPTRELLNSSDPMDIAELQWRLALPVSVIALLLLAVPLCRTSPRQSRYGRLVIAVPIFIIYFNLLGTAKVWVGRGVIPVAVGLWWVPLIPALLTLMLLRSERLVCRLGLKR